MPDNVNFQSFAQTLEWIKIVQHLEEVKKSYVEDMIQAGSNGDMNGMAALAGKCAMIDELIGLPEYLSGMFRNPQKGAKDAFNKEGE